MPAVCQAPEHGREGFCGAGGRPLKPRQAGGRPCSKRRHWFSVRVDDILPLQGNIFYCLYLSLTSGVSHDRSDRVIFRFTFSHWDHYADGPTKRCASMKLFFRFLFTEQEVTGSVFSLLQFSDFIWSFFQHRKCFTSYFVYIRSKTRWNTSEININKITLMFCNNNINNNSTNSDTTNNRTYVHIFFVFIFRCHIVGFCLLKTCGKWVLHKK